MIRSTSIKIMPPDDFSEEAVGRLVDIMREGEWRDRVGACKALLDRRVYVAEAIAALREVIREGEAKDSIRAAEILNRADITKPLSLKKQLAALTDGELRAIINSDVADDRDSLLA